MNGANRRQILPVAPVTRRDAIRAQEVQAPATGKDPFRPAQQFPPPVNATRSDQSAIRAQEVQVLVIDTPSSPATASDKEPIRPARSDRQLFPPPVKAAQSYQRAIRAQEVQVLVIDTPSGPSTAAGKEPIRPHIPGPAGSNRRQFLNLAAVGFGLPALRAAEPGFRFALIGDRTGTAAPQIYSRVWREVSLFGPDLAVSIGDTIQGGNDATAAKEWREMDDVWRRYRRFPTYFVPGNHDIWSAESKRLFEIEAAHPATHSFVHGGALFVILDNSLTDALPPGQLEYCERTLARHRDLRPKFVFCHRPSWLLDARVGNRNFGLHTLARKYGVDYVISGHGHQIVHLELDGVRYLEIGSIERGLKLGQGFKEGWFYHWIWARVRDGKVEMTVKEATGQGRLFRLSDWGPTGPKFDPGDPALLDRPNL